MNNMFTKSLTSFAAAALMLCSGILTSCTQEETLPETGTATVTIEVDRNFSVDSTSATVRFIPSENATGFRYAIGLTSDFESFRDGTMSTSVYVEGNQPLETTFDGLDPISMYSVYAVATDENDVEGSIASTKIVTDKNDFSIETYFLLSRSASFSVEISSDYSSVNYYFGQNDDIDAFLAGTLEDIKSVKDFDRMVLNYFDLEPDTDYTFFAQIIDRFGISAKVVEIPVHTPALGECPYVDFTYENDIYTGTYTLTPGEGSAHLAAIINTKGTLDNIINNTQNWKGDVMSMIHQWKDIEAGQVYQNTGTDALDIPYTTPTLNCSTGIEIYVLIYDDNGDPYGVEKFSCTTPEYDENAPEATATITVRDITTVGATYDYVQGEQNLACMYDTIDADWLDELMGTDEYTEFYLHDLLFSQGYYFHYNDGTAAGTSWSFTETAGQPGHRYYAAACPMNGNGPQGWGELVLVEFWTLEE